MKKCEKCSKVSVDEKSNYCHDCGGKLEQEIEEFFPKDAVKKVKDNSLVYIVALAITVISIASLTFFTIKTNNLLKEQRDIAAGLNINLQKKGNELLALQDTLSKTEEGKKQIELAKAQVDVENKALDTRATSAEQIAAKAKADLAKTQSDLKNAQAELNAKQAQLDAKQAELAKAQADLTAKQTELASIQASLSTKQAELASVNVTLAKAQRGVAKFNQTETLFVQYDQSAGALLNYFSKGYTAIINNDYATAQYYSGLIDTEIDTNTNIYNQISAIFTAIKTGNY